MLSNKINVSEVFRDIYIAGKLLRREPSRAGLCHCIAVPGEVLHEEMKPESIVIDDAFRSQIGFSFLISASSSPFQVSLVSDLITCSYSQGTQESNSCNVNYFFSRKAANLKSNLSGCFHRIFFVVIMGERTAINKQL